MARYRHGVYVAPGGPANILFFGDSIATGIAALVAALRTGDTVNGVVQANLGFDTTAGSGSGSGALGSGSNSFEVKGHDVYYVPGARNVAAILSVGHRDVQDERPGDSIIMGRFATMVSEIHALGWAEVVLYTIPACVEYNDPGGSPYTRPNRIAINAALRSGGLGQAIRAGAEYLVDTDAMANWGQADVGISGSGAPNLSDGIHPSSTGQTLLANGFHAVLP